MTVQHHPVHQIHVPSARPARCLRHHVWMAACDDCRTARLPRRRGGSTGSTPAGSAPADAG
ncbi:hypothetical protein ACI8AC_23945 [Geodermatophilus sp. SYSU D00758]